MIDNGPTHKRNGREFAPVYYAFGTPEVCQYYVDVSIENPGPMIIAGELANITNAAYGDYVRKYGVVKVEEAEEHVRLYRMEYDGRMMFVGVWCPYSKAIEQAGFAFGYAERVHYPRGGRLWCPAPQDKCEVQ